MTGLQKKFEHAIIAALIVSIAIAYYFLKRPMNGSITEKAAQLVDSARTRGGISNAPE